MTSVEYGVKVTNKFSIIDESDDPSEILNQLEKAAAALKSASKDDRTKKKQQPTKKSPASVVDQAKKAPAAVVVDQSRKLPGNAVDQSRKTPGDAKKAPPPSSHETKKTPDSTAVDHTKKFPNSAPYVAGKQKSTPPAAPANLNKPVGNNDGFGGFANPEENDENRGRSAGGGFPPRNFTRGGYRGGYGSRGNYGGGAPRFQEGRGRQYDRQSGSDRTGVKQMDKRDGGGSYNWGTPTDDIAADAKIGENKADESGVENEDKLEAGENRNVDESQENANLEQAKEEEESKELTLDEWKALQGPRAKPAFNVRRAGDGEAEEIKKKVLKPLKEDASKQNKKQKKNKGDAQEKHSEEEQEKDEENDERHRKIQNVDIVIKFAEDPNRGRGGRGTGGRGRGSFRGTEEGGFGGGRGRSGDFGGFSGAAGGGPRFGRGNGDRRGDYQNTGERGRGRREVPFKLDEETFPTLS